MRTLVLASFLVAITALGTGCSNDSLAGEGAPSQSGLTQGNAGASAAAGSTGAGSTGSGTGGTSAGQAGGTSTGQGGGQVEPGPAGGGGTTGGSAGTTGTAGQQGGEAGQGQGGGDTGPHQCGGIAGLSCGANEICVFNDPLCGAADQLGTCVQVPTQEECNAADSLGVCGCDGKTYGDLCIAAKAGATLATLSPCEPAPSDVCGGIAGAVCPAGKICVFNDPLCGAADQQGSCVQVPTQEECNAADSMGVCGCDGKTYGDLCTAAAAGVELAVLAPCEQPAEVCGGIAGAVCPAGKLCVFNDPLCGAADQQGTCVQVPTQEECNAADSMGVCGCDGKTYGDLCSAAQAGVELATLAPCEATTKNCGGKMGLTCGANEICVYGDTLCGAADGTGTCQAVPSQEQCNAADSMGVCGCDGKTYGDLCTAAAAGVSVATLAPCDVPQPEVCGGFAGFACPAGKICVYPDKWCGFADGMGVCVEVPAAAQCEEPLAIDVCGCDGKNYANMCEAAAAGADLASLFPCAQPGKSCGGLGGGVCAESEYCDYAAAEMCGAADGTGTCQARPTDCPAVDCGTPTVCGCDGNKYCTECEAKAAGTSVAPSTWCK